MPLFIAYYASAKEKIQTLIEQSMAKSVSQGIRLRKDFSMAFLEKIPLMYLVIGALFLGLAPFFPEPHLVEKTRMLINGTLVKPIDILDYFGMLGCLFY